MARWAIWSQVGFAIVGTVATLADQGAVPRQLFPPQPVLILCYLSILVPPVVVLKSGGRRKPGTVRIMEGIVTLGLALTTWFALLPLVQ
ncbi:MAG: hypothetical protein K1X67_20285 [Fimbriimonadaceae bacterium]|nr:hypothetical protein [Fimbriimonadaceae bacterium]